MAIEPNDLLEPIGPVTPKLFPGLGVNELTARLEQYISNAALNTHVVEAPSERVDGMTRALALSQAFTDVYIRMSAEPMTVNVTDKGSHGYSAEQIRNMKGLADKYRADFEALIILPGVVRAGITPGTMAVQTSVSW